VFFSVKELEVRKVRFDADFPPGDIDFQDQDIRQATTLHAEGSAELLSNTLGEIRITGKLSVVMEADCDRCLEGIRIPVDSDFDLFYVPDANAAHGHEVAINEAESEMGFYEDGGLELGEVLREHILLSLPMQHVCSEACRGICPQCGKNRNQGDCGCAARLADDRWSALQSMKESLPASSHKKN
jgi:uncharacterized protein